MPQLDLSLVLACYNEGSVFKSNIEQILRTLDKTRLTYEIIFVDDCSQDQTRATIDQIVANHPAKKLTRIFHDANVGRGGSVTEGIRAAQGEVVGFIDVDLEVGAHYIPLCVSEVQNGTDIATAHRIYPFYWKGLMRWILSRGYSFLVRILLHTPLKDTETGYKFFKRTRILPILDSVKDKKWFWDTEIMARSFLNGCTIAELPCLFRRRFDKQSTVRPIRDSVDYFLKILSFRAEAEKMRKKGASSS